MAPLSEMGNLALSRMANYLLSLHLASTYHPLLFQTYYPNDPYPTRRTLRMVVWNDGRNH